MQDLPDNDGRVAASSDAPTEGRGPLSSGGLSTAPERASREASPSPSCVHCGLCLSACPTYLELGTEMASPRGRLLLMSEMEAGTLPLGGDVVGHIDQCLGCRACETACPSGVPYAHILEASRQRIAQEFPRGWAWRLRQRLVTEVFPHPNRLRALLLPLRLLQILGWLERLRKHSRLLAMLPHLGWWQPLPSTTPAQGPKRHTVSLLSGCVQQVLFARTNRAAVRVLTRHGVEVHVPNGQGCCGALYLHAGDRARAQACARRNIDAFESGGDAILATAAGCGAMLKEYGQLLADDPLYAARAEAFCAKVRDATEWLSSNWRDSPIGNLPARVAYHDACHLVHGQGIREQPRALLRRIPGLELVDLEESETCCGSAGSYNLTEPEMAERLGRRKAAHIADTGATYLAVANPGCAAQIAYHLRQASSSMEVLHPIDLLDLAYTQRDHPSSPRANQPPAGRPE